MPSKLASLASVFDTKGGKKLHYPGFLTSHGTGVRTGPHYPGHLTSGGMGFNGDAKLTRFARLVLRHKGGKIPHYPWSLTSDGEGLSTGPH